MKKPTYPKMIITKGISSELIEMCRVIRPQKRRTTPTHLIIDILLIIRYMKLNMKIKIIEA